MASGGRYRFRYNICNIGNPNRIEFHIWVCFDIKYKRRQKYEYNLKRRVGTEKANRLAEHRAISVSLK